MFFADVYVLQSIEKFSWDCITRVIARGTRMFHGATFRVCCSRIGYDNCVTDVFPPKCCLGSTRYVYLKILFNNGD